MSRTQEARCGCRQQAERCPGQHEDARALPRLAFQHQAEEVDKCQSHQPRDGEMYQRRVQPADEIREAGRLALNLARSHRLDIAELFHAWRWVCRIDSHL
jgi:hypothetical protein